MTGALQSVRGIALEIAACGAGRPALLLHGFQNLDPASPVVARLARQVRVIAPSHPGFGRSPRPDGFRDRL